ncbi:proteasome family protein [Plasmopara halstedii]|uniref:Eukaryotic translation initiation factor 3 subunit M n=1 Tax=Plasmopara halstedii TaxID=4781 RepID=A0A0P1ADQ3_PLAHL|nr:proteasome family protein [Plasmopara halstedii]CEG39020.1 proteasome family protein [Plasmopara halstedii]|eukprot:XP_024575389.1 proteasome family protein [Plasmopara halstedii]
MASNLVAYVSKLLPSTALPDFSVEIKKKQLTPVIEAVKSKLPQLLALETEAEVEGVFALLFDVVLQTPQAQEEALKILQIINEDVKSSAILRLRLAASLFNKAKMLPKLQLQALMDVLTLARSSNNIELVAPYLTQFETLLDMQKLCVEDRRMLLLVVADVLEQAGDELKVLAILEKYLATYDQGKEVKHQVLRAVKIVLQNPVASFLSRVDLAASSVVQDALQGSKIWDLLDIISTKTLKEFVAFQKTSGAVFSEIGAVETELADTMRLFTLCTLPTGFKEIPYAEIAVALDVNEQDVEQWVVRAITAGVVNAKIDQLARTVMISRSLQRRFGVEQWKEIDAKLQLYKKNVGGLLHIIRNAQRAQEKH